jgi:hypothetical protein
MIRTMDIVDLNEHGDFRAWGVRFTIFKFFSFFLLLSISFAATRPGSFLRALGRYLAASMSRFKPLPT